MKNIINRLKNKILTAIQSSAKRIDLQIKLSLMIMSDRPTKQVDVALLFGRANGDDNNNFFGLVVYLYKIGLIKNILINGSRGERQGKTIPGESWAGGEVWADRLQKLGISKNAIHFFKPAYNTADEGRKMLAYAKKQGWKTAVSIAQPHQLLRCIAGLVRSMKTEEYPMRVYSAAPQSVDWFEKCAGSQGLYDMPRHDHIGLEYSRIQQYVFDLATLGQVFEYYQTRELIT